MRGQEQYETIHWDRGTPHQTQELSHAPKGVGPPPHEPAWPLVGSSFLALVAAMCFFAWLVLDPPSFLNPPYLRHTAMICIAAMFACWMRMMASVFRRH